MDRFQLTAWAVLVPACFLISACTPPDSGRAEVGQNMMDRVARAIARGEDRIGIESLADRIIARRDGFVLVDIRPEGDYSAGHIEGARHLSVTSLLSARGRAGLPGNRAVILYSVDGSEAAQAAALLRLAGVDAYSLDGGYAAWRRYMAGPTGTPKDVAEARAMAKQQAVACYFQGEYVVDAGLAVKTGGGYTPPLEPVQSAPAQNDPLGLGLGLGLGPESVQPRPQQQATPAPADPLGLGLGLGLGPDGASAPPPSGGTSGKLNIGEGC
jgi:rhodanese-related sulfurtransferase